MLELLEEIQAILLKHGLTKDAINTLLKWLTIEDRENCMKSNSLNV